MAHENSATFDWGKVLTEKGGWGVGWRVWAEGGGGSGGCGHASYSRASIRGLARCWVLK